jgi:hypothetical protein
MMNLLSLSKAVFPLVVVTPLFILWLSLLYDSHSPTAGTVSFLVRNRSNCGSAAAAHLQRGSSATHPRPPLPRLLLRPPAPTSSNSSIAGHLHPPLRLLSRRPPAPTSVVYPRPPLPSPAIYSISSISAHLLHRRPSLPSIASSSAADHPRPPPSRLLLPPHPSPAISISSISGHLLHPSRHPPPPTTRAQLCAAISAASPLGEKSRVAQGKVVNRPWTCVKQRRNHGCCPTVG